MLKYVILREPSGMEIAVFTLAPVTHRELAEAMQRARPGRAPVSAGFVEFRGAACLTSGHSDSLNLSPRPVDSGIIAVFASATSDISRFSQPQPVQA